METGGSFFSNQEQARIKFAALEALIAREQEKNKFLDQENTWLREQLAELKRHRFGTKSERYESEAQLVFNEVEQESKKPEPEEAVVAEPSVEPPAESQAKPKAKKRGHRKPLPEHLAREIVKIELPLAEQFAEDGTPLKIIGWEISEKIKYESAKISVVQYHRAKYGVEAGDYVKTAEPMPAIIPKGLATSELLAAIVLGKYVDGLPLYRMEDIFKRQDIELTRQTMARWIIKVAEACQPILNILSDRLLSSFYVACDETKTQVLKENGRPAESQSWMWVRSTPFGLQRVVLFNYGVSRSQEAAKALFLDFKGYLQCDGLNAYDGLESDDDAVRVGCNMHARRRFEAAKVVGAKSGKSLGEEGLKFYQQIYEIEESLREQPPQERQRKRSELALPIWEKMKAWVDANKVKVPKKSKIGEAFSYFENEYKYLTAYLKDGRLEADNGFTERAIRKFAIGRNNWMFSDTEAGASASALLYSLTVTARVNGVNPHRALVKMFDELPFAKTIEDYERIAAYILVP